MGHQVPSVLGNTRRRSGAVHVEQDDDVFVIVRIHDHANADLAEIVQATNAFGLFFALVSAGSNMLARMAIMAMTTAARLGEARAAAELFHERCVH